MHAHNGIVWLHQSVKRKPNKDWQITIMIRANSICPLCTSESILCCHWRLQWFWNYGSSHSLRSEWEWEWERNTRTHTHTKLMKIINNRLLNFRRWAMQIFCLIARQNRRRESARQHDEKDIQCEAGRGIRIPCVCVCVHEYIVVRFEWHYNKRINSLGVNGWWDCEQCSKLDSVDDIWYAIELNVCLQAENLFESKSYET